jgi:hypothetical protein
MFPPIKIIYAYLLNQAFVSLGAHSTYSKPTKKILSLRFVSPCIIVQFK